MISRRLIQFGKSSFVCSLPKEWIERNGLDKGAELAIEDIGTELRIGINEEAVPITLKKAIIDCKNKSIREIATEIVSAYLTNDSIIEIIDKKHATGDDVKGILRNLSGMEIVEETSSTIVAKDLLDLSEVNIPTLIRRIDVTVRSMLDDLQHMTAETAESIRSRDHDVNRMVYLAYRSMRKALLDPKSARQMEAKPLEILTAWNMVTNLERLGDGCKQVAMLSKPLLGKRGELKGTEIKSTEMTDIQKLLATVRDDYEKCMKCYYTKNTQTAMIFELHDADRKEQCLQVAEAHKKTLMYTITDTIKTMFSSVKHISRNILLAV